ncbi:uncharacterized protein LOC119187111 isoform X2 [Rhipicephalus microplus]
MTKIYITVVLLGCVTSMAMHHKERYVPWLHHCSYAWEDECPLPHRPNCAHTDAENLCHCDFAGFYAVLGLPK